MTIRTFVTVVTMKIMRMTVITDNDDDVEDDDELKLF